ncbi:MAG: DUF4861 family protein [Bacteroidales bacterium]
MKKAKLTVALVALGLLSSLMAQDHPWYYTEGSFKPDARLVFTIRNTLDIERKNCPVVIKREDFPYPDEYQMRYTIVDPALTPYEGPSEEDLYRYGGHQLRAEYHGHAIFQQFDDLDKDGIWDELFFQVDLAPGEEKTIYVYLGENTQGWNKHGTHANIGSYCRQEMPFWESGNVGWKTYFANCADVFAKRKPVLMADKLYMENYDGYAVQLFDRDWGSDIQQVDASLGGGGICLFEFPELPDSISLPRFTPAQKRLAPEGSRWNAGPISDTRYAYEVISNGPVRSIIKIKTLNWNTARGSYEVEQLYTAYTDQSYSTCRVTYRHFDTKFPGVVMGCGIRRQPGVNESLVQEGGIVISSGPEGVKDPENIDDREEVVYPFIGKALVVKDMYEPQYQYSDDYEGNHTMKVTPDEQNGFEYMIFAAWSDGAVYNNQKDFEAYVQHTSLEYNNPVAVTYHGKENKAAIPLNAIR